MPNKKQDYETVQKKICAIPAMPLSSKAIQENPSVRCRWLRRKTNRRYNSTIQELMEKHFNTYEYQQDQPASSPKRGSSIRSGTRWIYRRLPGLIIYGNAFLYMYAGWVKFMNMAAFIKGNSKH